jgi:hypothetical protein
VSNYVKVFAVLALIEKEEDIEQFIEEGVGDRELPLVKCKVQNPNLWILARSATPSKEIGFFRSWRIGTLQAFFSWQYGVNVPFLDMAHGKGSIIHIDFPPQTIMPVLSTMIEQRAGSGNVYKVQIHPGCHGFHEVLQPVRNLSR